MDLLELMFGPESRCCLYICCKDIVFLLVSVEIVCGFKLNLLKFSFLLQGTGPEVPKFLRYEGQVRNRRLGKRDTSLLIKDIWQEKAAHDAEVLYIRSCIFCPLFLRIKGKREVESPTKVKIASTKETELLNGQNVDSFSSLLPQ